MVGGGKPFGFLWNLEGFLWCGWWVEKLNYCSGWVVGKGDGGSVCCDSLV